MLDTAGDVSAAINLIASSLRLASPGDVLMVGEGIETCLAAMQATGNGAWAALSTSGLRTLALPSDVRDVIVLADGDSLDFNQRIARQPDHFDG